MEIIQEIFDAFGGPTKLAAATSDPVQTVHSWKGKGNVPRWRRAAVLTAACRAGVVLSSAATEYLRSEERYRPAEAA